MSVTSAAASMMSGGNNNTSAFGGGVLGMTKAGRLAAQAFKQRRDAKAAAQKKFAGSAIGMAMGLNQGPRGKAARIASLEERVDALEGSGESDVTQPSSTVNVPSTPGEGVGAAPALPEPTMGAAEEMFGGGAIRQIAAGAGKFKK
mgnify:CR=1 FL=1|tara:strand:+ start:894 stop:1331 length:438 start_codon:yes stop_codon:yes gene_type:complete